MSMDNYPPREIISPKAAAKLMEESKVKRVLSNVAEHDKWEEKRQESIKRQAANPKINNTPAPVIPILKSPRLKNAVNMNELANGSWSQLSFGMKNFEVLKAQEALQDVKILKGKADGIFGSETEQAVKTFQNSYAPTHTTHTFYQLNNIDGVVGKNTVLALDEAIIEEWIVENNNEDSDSQEMFWALSWLEQNSNHLVIPGSIAMGASENLLSGGNIGLITDVSDHYADYKSGRITKG